MTQLIREKRRASLAPPKDLHSQTARSIALARDTFALRLFREMSARVPAYRDFLRRNGVAPERIRTAADLSAVPAIDKKNYLSRYPFEALCWDGTLRDKALTYTATSGSTGTPFYFPRGEALDRRSSLIFELYLRNISRGRVKPTLVIVSFGMGVWIGGVITYQSLRMLAGRGYPVSVITPGANKKEVFEALRRLAPLYEQVVLGGYPPFLKDVLDEAPEYGFDPSRTPLKLLCAAEGFSEAFRDYVMKKGGAADPCFDTANIYGTADIGTMAIETPVAIALRRRAVADRRLYEALFPGAAKLPTLAQFHPAVTDFTAQDGRLLVTGDNELPLVRYDLGDNGGVIPYGEAMAAAERAIPGISGEIGDEARAMPPLPFVYVYERADFSTKLYGAIIYAEHVRDALQVPSLETSVTGKFSMATKWSDRQDEYLEINIELKPKVEFSEALAVRVKDAVVSMLCSKNAEYRYLSEQLKERVAPRVALLPYGHPDHFGPGGKQKWVTRPANAEI